MSHRIEVVGFQPGVFDPGAVLVRLYGPGYEPKEPLMCRELCVCFKTGDCPRKDALPNGGCGMFNSGANTPDELDQMVDSLQKKIMSRRGTRV